VEAAGGRAEILVDGGVRRGTDVVKAVGLGARACLIGRPYAWALAAGGQSGVSRLLDIFQTEIELAMAFSGCATIGDIDSTIVRMRGAGPTGQESSVTSGGFEVDGASR
jgi:isopentenyl diphosphate isomerase/L-lactate dehydrogenase-like FMN-dependent dehydrogenase